jgi:hypothetical protein
MTNTDSNKASSNELELAIVIPLTNYRTLHNLVFQGFHGQEEGEDPGFDRLCKREETAYKDLIKSIESYITKKVAEAEKRGRYKELDRVLNGKWSDEVIEIPDEIKDYMPLEERRRYLLERALQPLKDRLATLKDGKGLIVRDDRIRQLATVDEMAKARRQPLFIFRSDNAIAIYLFSKRIFASKVWTQ